MISRDSATPPWQQLADLLRGQITNGKLAPGDRLPSIAALSQEHDLALVTVRKAIVRLQREGLVESRTGWGTFVTGSER
jgi:DNA-binding GntR family transcriptional regulator